MCSDPVTYAFLCVFPCSPVPSAAYYVHKDMHSTRKPRCTDTVQGQDRDRERETEVGEGESVP